MIPNDPVRREAGPRTTSLPGPWSEAPNAPPGSPGCARPMSVSVVSRAEGLVLCEVALHGILVGVYGGH